jgi:hypothetical protein
MNIYKINHHKFKRLFWVSPFLGMKYPRLEYTFGKKAYKHLEKLFHIAYPKRKKFNPDLMPDHVVEMVKDYWKAEGLAYLEACEAKYDRLNSWLCANCQDVSLDGEDWQYVYSCDVGKYNSQIAKHSYALGDVKLKAKFLEKWNVPYEIIPYGVSEDYDRYYSIDLKTYGNYHTSVRGYALYAPIAPYQLDALERRDDESLLDWARNCVKSGLNPKVLNPFLPESIYNQVYA